MNYQEGRDEMNYQEGTDEMNYQEPVVTQPSSQPDQTEQSSEGTNVYGHSSEISQNVCEEIHFNHSDIEDALE